MIKYTIFLFVLFFASFTMAQSEKVVAVVNGETITRSELFGLLEKCYGEEEADSLRITVIHAFLEEMIIFKVIEQKLESSKITVKKEDLVDDAERYEKPFFVYYQQWGLENTTSFVRVLREKLLVKSEELKKKYSATLEDMQNRVLNIKDKEMLMLIYNDIVSEKELRPSLRKIVFEKYYVDSRLFRDKIKTVSKFRKYVWSQIADQEVENFCKNEEFALSDGLVKMSHVFLSFYNDEERKIQPSQEGSVLQKIQNIAKEIKPDLSNFNEVVQKYSEDKPSKFTGGDLDWVPRWTAPLLWSGFLRHAGWNPHRTSDVNEVVEAGYRLSERKLSTPIKSKWGYHLVLVTKRREGKKLEKKELLDRAKNMLAILKMEKYLHDWMNESKIERKL